MKPWSRTRGKLNEENLTPRRGKSDQFKLSRREALILLLAQHATLVDAILLGAAHVAPPLIAISMVTAFISTHRFFDGLIE